MYVETRISNEPGLLYADFVQNHTLPGVFPNFWRAVYIKM